MADLNIIGNKSLLSLNTLRVASTAEYFLKVTSEDILEEAIAWSKSRNIPVIMIGSGSNLVLNDQLRGLVIMNAIKGIKFKPAGNNNLQVTASSGENWHEFVRTCIRHGGYGLENLSLIPGTVGAAPVQNIGAYGVEVDQFITEVKAYDYVNQGWLWLDKHDCQFSYRDSLFKQQPGRFLITEVKFLLPQQFIPSLNYKPLQSLTERYRLGELSALQLSDEIIRIRMEKLPDPAEIPNVGSFFKNPVVSREKCEQLLGHYSDLVWYDSGKGFCKLAAGWLVERAGFKGHRDSVSGVGMHSKQALVLINPDQASGQQVLNYANAVKQKVKKIFGVELDREPVFLGENL